MGKQHFKVKCLAQGRRSRALAFSSNSRDHPPVSGAAGMRTRAGGVLYTPLPAGLWSLQRLRLAPKRYYYWRKPRPRRGPSPKSVFTRCTTSFGIGLQLHPTLTTSPDPSGRCTATRREGAGSRVGIPQPSSTNLRLPKSAAVRNATPPQPPAPARSSKCPGCGAHL